MNKSDFFKDVSHLYQNKTMGSQKFLLKVIFKMYNHVVYSLSSQWLWLAFVNIQIDWYGKIRNIKVAVGLICVKLKYRG